MWTEVAKVGDIAAGGLKFVKLGGAQATLANCDGTFYAVGRRCGHMNAPLDQGSLAGLRAHLPAALRASSTCATAPCWPTRSTATSATSRCRPPPGARSTSRQRLQRKIRVDGLATWPVRVTGRADRGRRLKRRGAAAAAPSRRATCDAAGAFDQTSDKEGTSMAFELPPLPWAEDALEPVTSARTIGFHYGKHHRAYVDNLNKLVAGTDLESRSLEEVIACGGRRPGQGGRVQQRRAGLEPQLLLAVDEAGRRRRSRAARWPTKIDGHLRRAAGLRRAVQGGGRRPLRQRLGLAGRRRRRAQDRHHAPTPRCRRRRSSRC